MNVALISPSQSAYSETFIRAHKDRLQGKIFYYYSGELPSELEGGLIINSRRTRIIDIVKGHFRLNRFSLEEQALITSFKNNKIDLVFAEYGGTGEMILPVCKALNLPLIVHFHGYDASRKDQLEIYDNYAGIFKYASYIICVSKKMEQDLINLGCSESKLVYNVYGPHHSFLKVNSSFSKPQFLAIGRFVNKKAPYYLILSFLEVLKDFPKAKLIIAGDGELWNMCKNLVDFYKIHDNVKLPGVINPDEYQNYLAESLAFVQHSITAEDGDAEGTPVSILEASAAGLPILSTEHAGIIDVVVPGKTGFLVKEHDVQGMADNMIKVLNDPTLAKALGKNGKQLIEEHFTLDRHISTLNDLIINAIHKA